jgi:activator of HSP90 ATPase
MKSFKKYYIIPEKPEIVYQALTNEITIKLWTGFEAIMKAEPDTEFSLWDDSICGKNIAFEPGKKIVQEWYFGDQEEASIVTIKLHEHNKGTSLELSHTNIPDQDFDDICQGWDEAYMGELIAFYTGE